MLPINIYKKDNNELVIEWDSGDESVFAMDMLRKNCPCATCKTARENAIKNPLIVLSPSESIPANIEIRQAEIIGRYAVQFSWSDGHHEGIYSFDYLRELSQNNG